MQNACTLTPASGTVAVTTVRAGMSANPVGIHNGDVVMTRKGSADKISPDPVHDMLTLHHQQLFTTGDIYIYDQCGRLMKQIKTTAAAASTKIDVNRLQAGIYMLELRRNGENTTLRFIKL